MFMFMFTVMKEMGYIWLEMSFLDMVRVVGHVVLRFVVDIFSHCALFEIEKIGCCLLLFICLAVVLCFTLPADWKVIPYSRLTARLH